MSADVRNAIALGVSITSSRPIDQIRAEAVGRTQSWPLAQKNQCELRLQQLTNIVLKCHSRPAHQEYRAESPRLCPQQRKQFTQHIRRMSLYCQRRKAFTDDNHQIGHLLTGQISEPF